jgi:histidine phosphotransfer protein HptB
MAQWSHPVSATPLHSQYAADPEMSELVRLFVSELPERAEAMASAWRAGDRELLRRLAHQLRGSGAGYGFPSMSGAAGELETALRSMQSQPLEAAAEVIKDKVEALLAVCRRAAVP